MLQQEVLKMIDDSVLCWLATSSSKGVPNVSPKEVFCHYGENRIIIANIASPGSKRNIIENPCICLSVVDILVQKGFQLKGTGEVIDASNPEFDAMEAILSWITQGKFPFSTIFVLNIEKVKPILAPSYLLYPETTEEDQIEQAKRSYGLKK